MKQFRRFVVDALVGGLLVLAPLYLAVLLLLRAVQSMMGLVHPFASLLPEWFPATNVIALILVLLVCFLLGLAIRTTVGRAIRRYVEKSLLEKVPGYAFFRSLARQLAGDSQERAWKPALAEVEDALVPAFIIEEVEGGRFAVFVPSVPTPLAGAIYVLSADRVHPLDVPLTQAAHVISHWGLGSKDLVAAMKTASSGHSR